MEPTTVRYNGSALARESREAAETRELYERYSRRLLMHCEFRLGSREEAEDAVQTTFLNAFRGLRRGDRPRVEWAWLSTIADNVCLDRHRSRRRRRRVETPRDLQALQDVVAAPERVGAEELLRLEEALAEMAPNQRAAVLLREWQGLSYREIAERLELSQAAVETLLFRARRSLAQRLEQPAPQRRRLGGLVDLGSLLGALKGLLGGAGVKVAATAAVTASAVVAAGMTADAFEPAGPGQRSERTTRVSEPAVAPDRPRRSAPGGRSVAVSKRPVADKPARASRERKVQSTPTTGRSAASRAAVVGGRRPGLQATAPEARPPAPAPEPAPTPGAPPVQEGAPPVSEQDRPVATPSVAVPDPPVVRKVRDAVRSVAPVSPSDPVGDTVRDLMEPVREVVEPVREVVEPVREVVAPVSELVEPVSELVPPIPAPSAPVDPPAPPVESVVPTLPSLPAVVPPAPPPPPLPQVAPGPPPPPPPPDPPALPLPKPPGIG